MAGQNEIDQLSIGIVADPSSLNKTLDDLPAHAAKKGEEAGKAYADGAVKGAGNGGGGTAPGGFSASTKSGIEVGVSAAVMLATAEKFFKIGEDIGNMLFQGVKVQLEAAQAMERAAAAFAQTVQVEVDFWNKRAGNDPSVSPQAIKNLASKEAELLAAQKAVAAASNVDQAVAGVADFVFSMPGGSGVRGMTKLGQLEEQLKQAEEEAQLARNQVNGIGKRNDSSSNPRTQGAVETMVAEELGISFSGRLQPGGSMSESSASAFADVLRSQPDLLRQLIGLQQGSVSEQQKTRIELIKGIAPAVR